MGYKNFISINQRNFQKVVFEKPNEPIQIPKIIPRISTRLDGKINCQQTFQKNQNRLRQQSQTKLFKTLSRAIEQQGDGNFKNIWNFIGYPTRYKNQFHLNPIGSNPLISIKTESFEGPLYPSNFSEYPEVQMPLVLDEIGFCLDSKKVDFWGEYGYAKTQDVQVSKQHLFDFGYLGERPYNPLGLLESYKRLLRRLL